MGMLDEILNSIQDSGAGDPHTQSAPGDQGMSPIAKALIGLLVTYAAKNMGGMGGNMGGAPPQPGGSPPGGSGGGLGDLLGSILGGGASGPGGPGAGSGRGGGLGGGLGDLLGGLLGGGAGAGSAINGGLNDLLKQFQQKGMGDAAHSWVGTGPNRAISPQDLESALGANTLDTLSEQTGVRRDALLNGLSRQLPRFVDQLTPDGRLPTKEEAAKML
jgi:uncharacterized protein YidB (DUF937 family)